MKRFDCLKAWRRMKDALVVSSAGAMTLEWNTIHPSDGNFRVRTLGAVLVHRSRHGTGTAASQSCRSRRRWFVVDESMFAADDRAHEAQQSCSHRFRQRSLRSVRQQENRHRCGRGLRRHRARRGDQEILIGQKPLKSSRQRRPRNEWRRALFHRRQSHHRKNPVPPFPIDEVENKYRFIRHIEKTEKIEIFSTNLPASYV